MSLVSPPCLRRSWPRLPYMKQSSLLYMWWSYRVAGRLKKCTTRVRAQQDHNPHQTPKGAKELSDGDKAQKGRDHSALTADVIHVGAANESCIHSTRRLCLHQILPASVQNERCFLKPVPSCLFWLPLTTRSSVAIIFILVAEAREGEVSRGRAPCLDARLMKMASAGGERLAVSVVYI